MKRLILLVALVLMTGCASQIKYERQPFVPPPKAQAYKMPADPFAGGEKPITIYLKKDQNGSYVVSQKEEADLVAFTSKDLNKINLRLQYLKDLTSQEESLINLHIQRENLLIDFIVDQNLLKELFREWNVNLQNKASSDKMWWNVEKGGYWEVILGLLIEAALLAAH